MWNTGKEGGWDLYKNITEQENFDDLIGNINNNLIDINQAVEKVNQISTNIKHQAFGKKTIKFGNTSKPNISIVENRFRTVMITAQKA